jgi:protein gp37
MGKTAIQWTTYTFNIVWGCFFKSRGCIHCYAKAWAERLGFKLWGKGGMRRVMGEDYWKQPARWNRAAEKAGRRERVFCCSMSDVFEDHPTNNAERAKLWPLIRATPWLDWQLLTKEADNIARFLPADWGAGYPNVWLGVSCEDQENADKRIPLLLAVPAHVRFLSCEPLLGPLELFGMRDTNGRGALGADCIEWVIVGGESGTEARAFDPADKHGGDETEWPHDLTVRQMPNAYFFPVG